ncbi:hypothetical protein HDU67_000204 [Dinochytrium kinnereticum]|nr:hypothetical protein HDU67_000204 [Dinochytrium kinnereticum]
MQDDHVGDDYFLNSGDKVRYFFEEGALNKEGELLVPKEKSINKIGHALHELDPVFRKFSTNPKLKAVAKCLGFHDPRVLQSMAILKNPKIGGSLSKTALPKMDVCGLPKVPTNTRM